MTVREVLEVIGEMLSEKSEIECTSERLEERYEIAPYNFRRKLAGKQVPIYYHELGQSMRDCICGVYEEMQNLIRAR